MVLLRHGDTEGRYGGDGSRIVAAIVLNAVNRGLHPDRVRGLLVDPQHRGGFACFRRRRNLDRWFAEECPLTCAPSSTPPPPAWP